MLSVLFLFTSWDQLYFISFSNTKSKQTCKTHKVMLHALSLPYKVKCYITGIPGFRRFVSAVVGIKYASALSPPSTSQIDAEPLFTQYIWLTLLALKVFSPVISWLHVAQNSCQNNNWKETLLYGFSSPESKWASNQPARGNNLTCVVQEKDKILRRSMQERAVRLMFICFCL